MLHAHNRDDSMQHYSSLLERALETFSKKHAAFQLVKRRTDKCQFLENGIYRTKTKNKIQSLTRFTLNFNTSVQYNNLNSEAKRQSIPDFISLEKILQCDVQQSRFAPKSFGSNLGVLLKLESVSNNFAECYENSTKLGFTIQPPSFSIL